VRKGKGELFDHLRTLTHGFAFVMWDYEYLREMSKGISGIIKYGTKQNDHVIGNVLSNETFLQVEITQGLDNGVIKTQLVGEYNLPNVLAAVTVGKFFEVPETKIRSAIENYTPSNSRSQLIEKGTNKIMVFGSYFDKKDNIMKDASKGLAIYAIDSKGKMVTKTYNSWEDDFAKYLPTNSKGKIDNVGFLYIHKVIQSPNGKMFVIGEGYKRQMSAGGTALKVLGALSGGGSTAGVTKIVTTDMVVMEFNDKYKITNATIYDKTNNTVVSSSMSDYNSQHAIGIYLKMTGSFDYEFTTGDKDNANFSVCYSDWVRGSDYKGETFNSIRFNGSKFSTDKIELKSKASSLKVFPAKSGSIMIMEYFKKDKRLDFRLEKLG